MPAHKLRVAVADAPCALSIVTAAVGRATGSRPQPQFQEIDRGQLIVELRLPAPEEPQPRRLARTVERSAPEIEVLSAWDEAPVPVRSIRARAERVVSVDELDDDPDLARRACDDCLPTAGWRPGTDHDRPHWLLAIPVLTVDRPPRVRLRRRDGYSIRFSALEAGPFAAPDLSVP